MSGRELDPDGTDSYHPEHPWEQAGHALYLPPAERTKFNWPPEPARPAGPHEARTWDQLPVRIKPEPTWDREYRPLWTPAERARFVADARTAVTPRPWWRRLIGRLGPHRRGRGVHISGTPE